MYPLEDPGDTRAINAVGQNIATSTNLPPVDGCRASVLKFAAPLPLVQPRVYFRIHFYEWRHSSNELIIAATSE